MARIYGYMDRKDLEGHGPNFGKSNLPCMPTYLEWTS